MKSLLSGIIVGLIILGSACDREEEVRRQFSLKLDSSLSKKTRKTVAKDLAHLLDLRINAPQTSAYAAVFGGTDNTALLTYLDARVKRIIAKDVDLRDRLILALPVRDTSPTAAVLAANVGTLLFYEALMRFPAMVLFKSEDGVTPVTSPRLGLIALGERYEDKNLAGSKIERASVWIHEARHSDCTGGITSEAFATLRATGKLVGSACGHLHVDCPSDHPLKGIPACDSHAWGAYAVGAVFAHTVANQCTNCSRSEKEAAKMVMLDSLSRITVLEDMMTGKLGAPDMESAEVFHMKAN